MRALIMYEYFCPQHIAGLKAASLHFVNEGDTLIPLEYMGYSSTYGYASPLESRPSGWRRLGYLPSRHRIATAIRDLLAVVRQEEVDVVAINGWFRPLHWALLPALKALGKRVVLVADTFVGRYSSAILQSMRTAFAQMSDAVFTAGSRHVNFYRRLGVPPERLFVGCDVVDNEHFLQARSNSAGDTIVVGTAARLVPEKNLIFAARALADLRRDLKIDLVFRVAGRGPERSMLAAEAAALQLPIELVGQVPYEQMPGFYGGLDLYWQPSIFEPWGLVINEAMAAALPVLASSACGAGPDLVLPENGWIHDPTCEEGTRAILRHAINNRSDWISMGESSLRLIKGFGLSHYARGLHMAMRGACGLLRSAVQD